MHADKGGSFINKPRDIINGKFPLLYSLAKCVYLLSLCQAIKVLQSLYFAYQRLLEITVGTTTTTTSTKTKSTTTTTTSTKTTTTTDTIATKITTKTIKILSHIFECYLWDLKLIVSVFKSCDCLK